MLTNNHQKFLLLVHYDMSMFPLLIYGFSQAQVLSELKVTFLFVYYPFYCIDDWYVSNLATTRKTCSSVATIETQTSLVNLQIFKLKVMKNTSSITHRTLFTCFTWPFLCILLQNHSNRNSTAELQNPRRKLDDKC